MIASTSKNHDNHNVVFFVLVVVVVAAADNGGTCLRGRQLTLTPLHISCQRTRRRRGGDPLSSKPRSYNDNNDSDNDNDDKDPAIASASKNDNNHDIIFFLIVSKATE